MLGESLGCKGGRGPVKYKSSLTGGRYCVETGSGWAKDGGLEAEKLVDMVAGGQ